MKIHKPYDDLVDPQSLKPHPKNPNQHSQAQLDHLWKIIQYQGWRKPITISKRSGFITSGHGRLKVALAHQLDVVPIVRQDYDSDEMEFADVVADNAIALQAELDLAQINEEVGGLGPDFDTDLLGIEGFTIDVADKGKSDPDAAPALPKKAKTRAGDLYQLGAHRLLCGDSTRPESLEKLMGGLQAELVFTDPPYRMEAEGGSAQPIGRAAAKLGEAIKHLCDFDPQAFFKILPKAFKRGTMNAYIFCNKDLVLDYLSFAKESGFSSNILFWKKPNAIPLGSQHRPDVEYLLLLRKSGVWNNGVEGVNYSKCLEYGRELGKEHPTKKPVELIANELLISSNRGGVVFDPFGGSGSTLIACEQTGRRCLTVEMDPLYCDVIVKRWEDYTGKRAVLLKPKVKRRRA